MSAPQQLGLALRRTDSGGKRRYVRSGRSLASEHQMHTAIASLLRVVIGEEGEASPHGVVWYSIDHANALSALTGALRKARGVIAAIPDIAVHYPPGRTLKIELKTADGELSRTKLRRNRRGDLVKTLGQVEHHAALRRAGIGVAVVRGDGEVMAALREHGVPLTREALV